jgi:hypothetical protein
MRLAGVIWRPYNIGKKKKAYQSRREDLQERIYILMRGKHEQEYTRRTIAEVMFGKTRRMMFGKTRRGAPT